ncbi:hypothetical protein [Patulibacter medicamentivorans]|uniref:hypothetical protein n=1 Tax=Patulibacter medicamentivorans TaxID=1097667 RepID=UPI00058DDB15|nr:hypothetical protein [Patulibacter medicamentivorans]
MAPSSLGPPESDWEELHGFRSLSEFRRFEQWIIEAKEAGALKEVPVERHYSGIAEFAERWFEEPSGQVWRLVGPDAPFQGVFIKVST